MNQFKVEDVLDTNKISVVGGWNLKSSSGIIKGKIVNIRGYSVPPAQRGMAIARLKKLLMGQEIALTNAKVVTQNDINNSVIECKVLLNDVDIAYYFPEYTQSI